MKGTQWRLVVSLLIWGILVRSALGDDQDSLKSNQRSYGGETCYRGKSLPQCKVFFITEFGSLRMLNKKPRPEGLQEPSNWYLTGDLGLMVNLNRKSALGGTLFVGGGDDGGSFGVLARYRRWFGTSSSNGANVRLDLSLGPLLSIADNHIQPRSPGLAGNISLNIGDWIAVLYHVEVIRYGPKDHWTPIGETTNVANYIGIKGCSYLSFVAMVLMTVLYAAST
jgi:hypothetical protein